MLIKPPCIVYDVYIGIYVPIHKICIYHLINIVHAFFGK